MMISPPSGIASFAFTTRFIRICSIWPGSALMLPIGVVGRNETEILSPTMRSSMVVTLFTTSFRFRTLGKITCCRLKARSCRVSMAARSDAFLICARCFFTGLSAETISIDRSL
jgi:hypothetical protein